METFAPTSTTRSVEDSTSTMESLRSVSEASMEVFATLAGTSQLLRLFAADSLVAITVRDSLNVVSN